MGHQSKKVYVTNGKDSEEVVFSFFFNGGFEIEIFVDGEQ